MSIPETITPAYLIEKISYDKLKTLRADAGIRITGGDEFNARLTGVLNYKSPGSLALALFGPFGITVMKMWIVDGSPRIYIPKKDTLYTTDVAIPFILPDSTTLTAYENRISETEDDHILSLYNTSGKGKSLSMRYYFSKTTLENHTIEKYYNGKAAFTIEIREFGEYNIPSEFSVAAGAVRFDVATKDLQVNPHIPDAAFRTIHTSKTAPLQDFFRALEPSR